MVPSRESGRMEPSKFQKIQYFYFFEGYLKKFLKTTYLSKYILHSFFVNLRVPRGESESMKPPQLKKYIFLYFLWRLLKEISDDPIFIQAYSTPMFCQFMGTTRGPESKEPHSFKKGDNIFDRIKIIIGSKPS